MKLIPVTAATPGAVGPGGGVASEALIDPTAVAAALARGLGNAPTAIGNALLRLCAESAGAPELVVGWHSCLLPPPPEPAP